MIFVPFNSTFWVWSSSHLLSDDWDSEKLVLWQWMLSINRWHPGTGWYSLETTKRFRPQRMHSARSIGEVILSSPSNWSRLTSGNCWRSMNSCSWDLKDFVWVIYNLNAFEVRTLKTFDSKWGKFREQAWKRVEIKISFLTKRKRNKFIVC